MSKFKVQIELTENALKEFKEIQSHPNPLLADGGEKYLKKLINLPAANWLKIRQHWDNGVFKISDVVPFDVRGKVEYKHLEPVITVFITHFKLKTSVQNTNHQELLNALP